MEEIYCFLIWCSRVYQCLHKLSATTGVTEEIFTVQNSCNEKRYFLFIRHIIQLDYISSRFTFAAWIVRKKSRSLSSSSRRWKHLGTHVQLISPLRVDVPLWIVLLKERLVTIRLNLKFIFRSSFGSFDLLLSSIHDTKCRGIRGTNETKVAFHEKFHSNWQISYFCYLNSYVWNTYELFYY